jgi:predicted RND superfamily exporter protein
MPVELAATRLLTFEERLTRDLVENLYRLREVSTPKPITVADLPASLRQRYVGKSGKWLLRVFARDCLWDHAPLKRFADQIRTVDAAATGKPFATLEGLQSLKSGFLWAGLYALAAIVLVFLIDFRHLRHTLLALTPLAMGVLISLGIMGLCGLPLNPANIIALPLILGVGAVYGVHVVHDYLVRRRAPAYTLSYIIGRAILVMALTNMISFGTLLTSSHRGLSGLGFTLMLGVSCCMLSALVFLPAVLRVLSTRGPAHRLRTILLREVTRMAA